MGYLTTVTIYNDAMGAFESDPKHFGERILEGITQANRARKEVSIGFMGYCNYISVQPSRHADAHTVYLHSGNTVFNLCPYGDDFTELAQRSPELAKELIERAQGIVTDAKKRLATMEKKKVN